MSNAHLSYPIKIVIAGINGRFGRAAGRMICDDPELRLVGAFGRKDAPYAGSDVGHMIGTEATGVHISKSFQDQSDIKPDVLLDFTVAESAFEHARYAVEHNIRVVIGTSGVGDDKIKQLSEIADRNHCGVFVVPNFSIGAVLMMEFSRQAAAYFDNVEIIEMHHTLKQDSPSGTAMHTISKLEELGKSFNRKEITEEHELLANSRGGRSEAGINVHSLRLPGLISHQEVIFGAPGELLTVRHDGLTVEAYLRGVKMAIKAVMKMNGLTVGLDKILNLKGEPELVTTAGNTV